MTAGIGHGTSWGTSHETGPEISQDAGHDTTTGGLGRGMGFGRGGGSDSLAGRREAAQRRLSSSTRAAELVECALRRFDEALADQGVADADASLRATVRAVLSLAYGTVDYDVTLLANAADLAVRVRNTSFGPEAEVVDRAVAADPPHGPVEAAIPHASSPWTDASALR
jgi:hypothetical protein